MSYTEVQLESDQLEEVWEERALRLLNEEKSKSPAKILELREITKKHTDLQVPQDDEFFLKFLRGGNMEPEAAFRVLQAFFTLRKSHPRYFKSCLNLENLIRTTYDVPITTMLPHRDADGRRVFVFRPGLWNPDKVPFADIFCSGYTLCEMTSREERTQIAGYTAIVDAEGFGWKQLRNVSMEDGRNAAGFFNIAFPVWLRKIHILKAPRVFNILFGMLRPFLSESVQNEVVFHAQDLSTMKEYFRLDLIPKDLGGTGSPADNSLNSKRLRSMKDYFEDLEKFGYSNLKS